MKKEMLERIVKEAEADVKAEVKKRVLEGVQQDIVYQVRELISKEVKEFVDSEVLPDLKVYLTQNKGPILEAMRQGADGITAGLKEALMLTINEKMKEPWGRQRVIEALFK